jgi:galactokinase
MDRIVADIAATPGVFGARMTGGGFGGCVVALAEPGALTPDAAGDHPVWITRPVAGAAIVEM